MKRLGLSVVLAVAALLAPASAQTSTTGSLQGTVKDQKGGLLPGATVVVKSDVLVARQISTVSDNKGIYRFPSLPPGVYRLEADFPGMGQYVEPELRIRFGQAMALDIALNVADVKEEVTVTSKAPLVSVVTNVVATNFDQAYVAKQPLPRNYYQVVQTAPGINLQYTNTSGSSLLAFGGTSSSQNAFTIDGVNVADAAGGGHWVLPSIRWMQEIEVGGLGANAEFGGYTGGVINGVTKSGGNTLSGDVEIFYQPASWTSSNNPDPTAPAEEFKFQEFSVNLGGPIVKDKLWFFVAAEQTRSVTTPFGAVATSDRKIPRYLGKLTWQINEKQKLSWTASYDGVKNERRGIDASTLPEATSLQDGPSFTTSLQWESIINANNFVSVKATGYDGRDDYLPYNGTALPGRVDEDTGLAWQNQEIQQLNHRHIVTLNSSWTHFNDNLFGKNESHAFKFGVEVEDGKSSDVWRRNGGFTYYDDSSFCSSFEAYLADPSCGANYIERGFGEYDEEPEYSGLHFYAQDSVRFDRWTINAGLRYGSYKGGWKPGKGNRTVYDVSFIDPRLGFVWDVRGDARSALKAHIGRYHDKMYTYLFDREASGNAVIPDQDCFFDPETNDYTDCDTPTAIRARMGEVDHPYVDELLLSYEQQFGRNMMVGVDLIDRRFRNIMTMRNVNNDYEVITATGNPLTGGTLTIYNLLSEPDFVLTTKNGAYRDLRSAVLRFERRFSDGWDLRASVVYNDLQGNIRANNGYANDWRDLNGLTNGDGQMDFASNKWEVKVGGSLELPLNLRLSGQFSYFSGWYYTPFVRVTGLDFNSSFGRDINLVPRGSVKLPSRELLDMKLSWTKPLPKDTSITVSLECFNCMNKDTVIDVFNRWGGYSVSRGTWSPRANYGDTFQIESPRQVRAGVRYSF